MNRKRGQVSWIGLLVLISLLLFKGVAAAAMLCCGPDHSAHSVHSSVESTPSAMDHSMMSGHSHHNTELPAQASSIPEHQACDHHQMMADDSVNQFMNDHQSSCSSCAVSCAAAVLMINPSDFIAEPPQNERILSLTSLVVPLTLASLERPPRLYS
jgi:hypothetical protein